MCMYLYMYKCVYTLYHVAYTQMTTIWTQAGMIEVGGRGDEGLGGGILHGYHRE